MLISNNCEEFAVTVRHHFDNLMKKYQSKTRLEIKGNGLGGADLSENKQLLADITERFKESKRRSKADTQKKTVYIENEKKKAQEMRKKHCSL